jgi:hypothetical protein
MLGGVTGRRSGRVVGGAAVVLLGLFVLLTGCGSGNDDPGAQPNPGELFPDRANQYEEDQEREVGDPAMLSGYTTSVVDVEVTTDIPADLVDLGLDAEDVESVVARVQVANRDDEPQPASGSDWTLVDPEGSVHEVESSTLLASGDGPLEVQPDEQVDGEVTFVVDAGLTGDFYLQYKPDGLDAARGIWRLQVS